MSIVTSQRYGLDTAIIDREAAYQLLLNRPPVSYFPESYWLYHRLPTLTRNPIPGIKWRGEYEEKREHEARLRGENKVWLKEKEQYLKWAVSIVTAVLLKAVYRKVVDS